MESRQTQTIVQRLQSLPSWAIVLLTIIYVVSPLDLVPDPFCGVGLFDDAGVILFAVVTLCRRWFGSAAAAPASTAPSLP